MGTSKRELIRIIERERAAHQRTIDSLLDRIADLAGKPWTLPPRETAPEPEARLWSPSPEQHL